MFDHTSGMMVQRQPILPILLNCPTDLPNAEISPLNSPLLTLSHGHTTNSTYSGLCPNSTRKPEGSSSDGEARVERGGASIEGDVDPKNPDILEGSKTWFDTSGGKRSFAYTATWRLQRKPLPLMITNIRFYEPLYPSPNDWYDITDRNQAVDGNQVKIVATVANLGATEKTATVNFKELKENVALPDGSVTATIPANSQKDVELIWDTSGYAWRQSGEDVVPEINRQIEARIPDDSLEKDLTVVPKPVILLWGFWQSAEAFDKFRDYFKAVNEKWTFWAAQTDVTKVSTDNADIIDSDVRKVQKRENAWHVDLVAVQNGGLAGRVYVNSKMPTMFDGRPAATHLIMMGTPNMGTPCAVGLYGLSFRMNTFNIDAVGELSPESMKRFNLLVNNTNGTKFAVLAGDSYDSICQEDIRGDGIAPVASAIWRVKTNAISHKSVKSREFIGEVSHFRQVYKWLAVPPKGDHAPDPSTLSTNFMNLSGADDSDFAHTRRYGAMFAGKKTADETDPRPELARGVTIPGKKSVEIEVPAKAGSRFSVVFLASPDVSVTLIDENGQVVGSNLADTPEASEVFRGINVKKLFPARKWKLRLENRAVGETQAVVTAFVDYPTI